MNEEEIKDFSEQLLRHINCRIDFRVNEIAQINNYKGKYEHLVDEIKRLKEQAQTLYDNMKKGGLTFGLVEAEGYLRAFKTIEGNGLLDDTEST